MKYDVEWMLAVLDDLRDFCEENKMPISKLAVLEAKLAAQKEAAEKNDSSEN